MIGPMRGGRVTAVTGVPSNPQLYYMGSTGGGIWKTTDAGHSWVNISDGQLPVGSMGAIEVSLSDPNVDLRRHRFLEDPQQRLDRQGDVQVDRRRKNMDVQRAARASGRSSTIRVSPTEP